MKNINITEPQFEFLLELYEGETLVLCIEPGDQFGKFIGKERFKGNIHRKTIFKLYQTGFVTFTDASFYGVRYFECRLSEKSRDYLRSFGE